MSSTLKMFLAFGAGLLAYGIYDYFIDSSASSLEPSSLKLRSDTPPPDSAFASGSCACDNSTRFTATSASSSQNFPISDETTCQSMVNGTSSATRIKGAWFSKRTLDIMFCGMMDANGIFVYTATMPEDATDTVFIVEAAHRDAYLVPDTTRGTIFYSRSLCPDMCGVCAE